MGAMSEPARSESRRRSSLRDQQADLTRELIMRAFQGLLQNDHPDAITFPQVAEAAGVSLRTVYRYFPTRVDLLQSAAAWLAEFTGGARWVIVPVLLGAGALIGFGAKTAGGCTSGNGLSGNAILSPASLVATATFFGTAIAVSFAIEALT